MIEIEKKFILEKGKIESLLADAMYVKTYTLNDKYYDDSKYSLTLHNWWLRFRDGIFELKVPLSSKGNDEVDQYNELKDEQLINQLNLNSEHSLKIAISDSGYFPFASIITRRKVYKKAEFTIVIDSMDYGYEIGEIELLVAHEKDGNEASKKILALARQYGLNTNRFRGKVFEYLWRYNRAHYDALLRAGVVKV